MQSVGEKIAQLRKERKMTCKFDRRILAIGVKMGEQCHGAGYYASADFGRHF